jgi:hypothetical protein
MLVFTAAMNASMLTSVHQWSTVCKLLAVVCYHTRQCTQPSRYWPPSQWCKRASKPEASGSHGIAVGDDNDDSPQQLATPNRRTSGDSQSEPDAPSTPPSKESELLLPKDSDSLETNSLKAYVNR